MTAIEQHDATPCEAGGCTRPQAPGILLCLPDSQRLGDWLAQIQTEYEQLSAVPSMQGREYGTIGGTTLAGQRNPARLDVLVLRDRRSRERDGEDPDGNNGRGVLEILHARAEEVREGRDLAEPVTYAPACRFPCMHRSCLLGHPRPVRQPLTVARERRLLSDHLDWVMAQDWCGEFFDEIRALWSLLRSANGTGSGRRLERFQNPCDTCGVRALTHRPGSAVVSCENCGITHTFGAGKMSA